MRARRTASLVINWNGSGDTLELLDSLVKEVSESFRMEAFVIDNGSTPEELAILQKGLGSISGDLPVRLIRNENNVGVPRAYNQAIQAAGPDFDDYLRLDNDVVLLEGALGTLVSALECNRDKEVRLVGGNVRFHDKPSVSNGGAVAIDLLRGRTRVSYPAQDVLCDGVLGCVMLMDGEVVRSFWPTIFDPWLFLTTDESELSLRCKEKGWQTLYVARALALHKGGRSTARVPAAAASYSARNWSYLSLRYVQPRWMRALVVARILTTAILKVAQGRAAVSLALLRGIAAAMRRASIAR